MPGLAVSVFRLEVEVAGFHLQRLGGRALGHLEAAATTTSTTAAARQEQHQRAGGGANPGSATDHEAATVIVASIPCARCPGTVQ